MRIILVALVCFVAVGLSVERTAAQGAAGPCAGTGRYVDCGNGTVTDTATGLIWLKDSNCFFPDWDTGNRMAAGLSDGNCGLTDNSSPGEWRLATKDEWAAMTKQAVAMGCMPRLTNDAGTECFNSGFQSSFLNIEPGLCFAVAPGSGWNAFLDDGEPCRGGLDGSLRVWPVRGKRR